MATIYDGMRREWYRSQPKNQGFKQSVGVALPTYDRLPWADAGGPYGPDAEGEASKESLRSLAYQKVLTSPRMVLEDMDSAKPRLTHDEIVDNTYDFFAAHENDKSELDLDFWGKDALLHHTKGQHPGETRTIDEKNSESGAKIQWSGKSWTVL